MAAIKEQRELFELDCPDSRVGSVSFVPDGQGGIFTCSISALSDSAVDALDDAKRRRLPVRLVFTTQPIVLDLVTLERREPHAVRIVGRVLRADARP